LRSWDTNVVLVDNDEQKLADLRSGEVPIHERFLPESWRRLRGNRLVFSGESARERCERVMPSSSPSDAPTDRGDADMSYVESVAREIAGAVDSYKVVVERARFRFTPASGFAR